jgi:hypothetical protein
MKTISTQVIVMRTAAFSIAAAGVIVAMGSAAQDPTAVTFDHDKTGAPPPGFVLAAMRQPAAGTWLVRRQGARGHLVHEADPSAHGYALAIRPEAAPRDLTISVRLRLAGGSRSGGLVWSYQDVQNYHASVLDLARGEVAMYRMAAGNRIQVEFEDDLELDTDAWHTMKVVHTADSTRISLGGIRVFEDEHRNRTDRGAAGRVGLIASGDAEVWFDDLRIGAAARSR